MGDHSSILGMAEKYMKPTSIPKLLTSFTSLKTRSDTFENAVMSPTSILDNIPFSTIKNSFWPDQSTIKPHESETAKKQWDKTIGLGLVDVLTDGRTDSNSQIQEEKKTVLFGTKLKVYVPPLPPQSPAETGNSQPCSSSKKPAFSSTAAVLSGSLSPREIELSEDYTCVISHVGPTPTTTHIFDNCILDRFCFSSVNQSPALLSRSFLSYCHTCKKNIDQGQDIYIYRGEMAFCSSECRYQEILFEESSAKAEDDEVFRTVRY